MAKRKGRKAPPVESAAETPRAWAGALVALLGAAAALKVAVLLQLGGHPLLQPYGDIDGGVYARLAARIAHGDVLLRGEGPVPYFVSPLYAYFLAACGASWPVARVVQVLLGVAAVGLIFLTARRLFGARAALVAGVLYAATGVVTFHEVVILQAAIDPFLTALFLFLLAVGVTSGSISLKVWVAAGVAGGLLALNRPNALLAVLAVAIALPAPSLVARRRADARRSSLPFEEVSLRTFLPAATLLFGTGLAIAPFTLRNLVVSHELVLISSHGGLNFLVGNNPEAPGVYRALPGITPDIGGQAADAKLLAEKEEGRSLSSREVSAYFGRKAWKWIAANPGDALSLFLRKMWYLLSGDEAPLNFSFPWYRERSLALEVLFVGPGLLVPLGAAGFVFGVSGFARIPRRALLAWAAFVPAYVAAVAAFFVATRYRLPLLVALAPFAGNALTALPEAWQAGRTRALLAAGVAAAVLAAVALRPTGIYDGGADEDMHWALWLAEKGEAAEAARVAGEAASRHPDPGLVWFRVGQAWMAAKRLDDAIAAFRKANGLPRHPSQTAHALAGALEARAVDLVLTGRSAEAFPDFEAAAALAPEEPAIVLNLAAALAERGEAERARALARKALALRPGYEKAEALLKALGP